MTSADLVRALPPAWRELLADEFAKDYFASLAAFVDRAYATETVYPPRADLFTALDLVPPGSVRVVILGQDPYHEPGQARGLAFSVPSDVRVPPSLRNVYRELENEYGASFRERTGDLTAWARHGVLLLNATLTVAAGRAGSHRGRGWETFTDAIVTQLSRTCAHLVFLLWGVPAQKKLKLIDQSRHLVLTAAHPSPLSAHRGFFGCGHFQQANAYLVAQGRRPVVW